MDRDQYSDYKFDQERLISWQCGLPVNIHEYDREDIITIEKGEYGCIYSTNEDDLSVEYFPSSIYRSKSGYEFDIIYPEPNTKINKPGYKFVVINSKNGKFNYYTWD